MVRSEFKVEIVQQKVGAKRPKNHAKEYEAFAIAGPKKLDLFQSCPIFSILLVKIYFDNVFNIVDSGHVFYSFLILLFVLINYSMHEY